MLRKPLPLLVALALLFATAAHADRGDIGKVNGSIHVVAGEKVGNVETVNGSIRIDDGATAGKVSTVNGSVAIYSHAAVDAIESVNGGIEIGEGTRVANGIQTVNGAIVLQEGSEVAMDIENVSGRITLHAARVHGAVRTVNGDIEIGADSRVGGGIVVDRVSDRGWSFTRPRTPRIVIGPRAVVEGTVEIRREVELFVSDSATVGTITGATAKSFSGERP